MLCISISEPRRGSNQSMSLRLLNPLLDRASHRLPRSITIRLRLPRCEQSNFRTWQRSAQRYCGLGSLPRFRRATNASAGFPFSRLSSSSVYSDSRLAMATGDVSGDGPSLHEDPEPDLKSYRQSVLASPIDHSESSSVVPSEATNELGSEVNDSRDNGMGATCSEGENLAKRLRVGELAASELNDERERRIIAAWDHWRKLGEPKMHVAPMVDQSELPFRMLCRKYGATAAYTPMLHSRLFAQDAKYRVKEFTTCPEDRPLFVQFCANNPDTLLKAARLVESCCDYVDINLGCPQRIAKKGNYGAFLMDNLPLVKSLVSSLASNLTVPVSCKIRVFPKLEDTLAYARMLEEAGCSLLAVHGRTRDQKDGKLIRADWEAIQAVKKALRIPVLANGNIRWLEDVHACIASTGADGVMSADSLLENPALYAGYRMAHSIGIDKASSVNASAAAQPTKEDRRDKPQVLTIDERTLMLEYLDLCEKYPVPMRMVRGHVHKILGGFWFKQNPDIREDLNKQHVLTIPWLKDMVQRLMARSVSNYSFSSMQEPQLALSSPPFSHQELPLVATVVANQDVTQIFSPAQEPQLGLSSPPFSHLELPLVPTAVTNPDVPVIMSPRDVLSL